MFSRNTEAAQQFHNGYHGLSHARWSDGQQIRPDLIGLAPPPHQIMSVNRESYHTSQGTVTLDRNQPIDRIMQSNQIPPRSSYYGNAHLPATSSYNMNLGLMGPPPRQQPRLDSHVVDAIPRFQCDTIPNPSEVNFHSPPVENVKSPFPSQKNDEAVVAKTRNEIQTPKRERGASTLLDLTVGNVSCPKPFQEIDTNIPRRQATQDKNECLKVDANNSTPHGKGVAAVSSSSEPRARFQAMSPISMCFNRMLGAGKATSYRMSLRTESNSHSVFR
jgi:hypothetical protein